MDGDSSTNTARKDASELAAAEAAAREKAANARLRAEAARAAIAAAEAAEEAALAAADAAAEARRVNSLATTAGSGGARGNKRTQQYSPGARGAAAAEAHAASKASAAAKIEREHSLELQKESQRRQEKELKRRDRAVEEERIRGALAEEDRKRQARVREAEEKERARRALIEEDNRWERKAREVEQKERAKRDLIDEDNWWQRNPLEAEKTEVFRRAEAHATNAANPQVHREPNHQEQSEYGRFATTEAARQARVDNPRGRSERERMEAISRAEAARETALREAAEAKAKIHYLELALQAQIDSREAEKRRRKELKREEKKKAKKAKKDKKRASQHHDDADPASVALEVSQVEENLLLMKQSIQGKTLEISRAKKEAQELADALAFEESELLQESEALLKRQSQKNLEDTSKVNGDFSLSAEKIEATLQHSISQHEGALQKTESINEAKHQVDETKPQAHNSVALSEAPSQRKTSEVAVDNSAVPENAGDEASIRSELSPPPPPPSASASESDEDESVHEPLDDEDSDDCEVDDDDEEEDNNDDDGSQNDIESDVNPSIERNDETGVAPPSSPLQVQFAVGDQVDVRDDIEESWEPGTVLELDADGSPQVQKEGYDKAYSWEHVRHSPLESNRKLVKETVAEFAVNDRVEVRDDPEEEWELGTITEFDEDGAPQVQKDGYATAYSWQFIRPLAGQADEPGVGLAEQDLDNEDRVDKGEDSAGPAKDEIEASVISTSQAPPEITLESKDHDENTELEDNFNQEEDLLTGNETSARNTVGDEMGVGVGTNTMSPRSPEGDSRDEANTPGKKSTLSPAGKSIVAPSRPFVEDGADELSSSGSSSSSGCSSGKSGPIESILSELTVSDDEGILTPANVVVKLEASKKEQPEYKAVPPVAREEAKNDEEVYAEWPQSNPASAKNGGYEKVRFDDRDHYDEGPSWHSALADIVAHRQMLWTIMPPIWLLSFFSYLDRCNLAVMCFAFSPYSLIFTLSCPIILIILLLLNSTVCVGRSAARPRPHGQPIWFGRGHFFCVLHAFPSPLANDSCAGGHADLAGNDGFCVGAGVLRHGILNGRRILLPCAVCPRIDRSRLLPRRAQLLEDFCPHVEIQLRIWPNFKRVLCRYGHGWANSCCGVQADKGHDGHRQTFRRRRDGWPYGFKYLAVALSLPGSSCSAFGLDTSLLAAIRAFGHRFQRPRSVKPSEGVLTAAEVGIFCQFCQS